MPQEWVRFLEKQPADLEDAKLADLRTGLHLGADGNAEIALSWLALVIRTAYEPAYPDLERFLLETGRWHLVVTLYTDLARTESGNELGRRIYAKAKPGYHVSIRAAVERRLYPTAPDGPRQCSAYSLPSMLPTYTTPRSTTGDATIAPIDT